MLNQDGAGYEIASNLARHMESNLKNQFLKRIKPIGWAGDSLAVIVSWKIVLI